MPAARQRSRSPFIACAVIAMIGKRGAPARRLERADRGGRLESAHLRHLHVHQHDVERLRARRASTASRPLAAIVTCGRAARAGSPPAAG